MGCAFDDDRNIVVATVPILVLYIEKNIASIRMFFKFDRTLVTYTCLYAYTKQERPVRSWLCIGLVIIRSWDRIPSYIDIFLTL